jgi:hypothetical protein
VVRLAVILSAHIPAVTVAQPPYRVVARCCFALPAERAGQIQPLRILFLLMAMRCHLTPTLEAQAA